MSQFKQFVNIRSSQKRGVRVLKPGGCLVIADFKHKQERAGLSHFDPFTCPLYEGGGEEGEREKAE
jgi:hypothetical protein